jgi:hypothetical protein
LANLELSPFAPSATWSVINQKKVKYKKHIAKHTNRIKQFASVEYSISIIGGGLGPKSHRGNRIYKSHKDIAKKASIPLKMYLKNLAILQKATISLKKSLKIFKIFIKVPHF